MSVVDGLFYIGPRGNLRPLPGVQANEPGILVAQAEGEALDGTVTVDRFGIKPTWKLDFEFLTPDQEADLVAMRTGMLASPLYLVSPLGVNVLPPEVASTGSSPFRDNPFQSNKTGIDATITTADPATFPMPRPHKSILRIDNTHGTTAVQVSMKTQVPVLEETYTASAWMNVQGGSMQIQLARADGGTVIWATDRLANKWVRLSATGVPRGGSAFVRFQVDAHATADVAGIQLERGELSAWVPGTGTPRVILTDLSRTSPLYPYTTLTATFRAA